MTALPKVQTAEKLEESNLLRPCYLESLNLVERLHRQLLDVIKDELDRRGERVVNSVQALLLFNIGDQHVSLTEKGNEIRDVVTKLFDRHLESIEAVGNVTGQDFEDLNTSLRRLERFWLDQVRYRL